jgi:hypothetical protein
MSLWDDEIDNHFCDRVLMFKGEVSCKAAGKPCNLCLAQRNKKRDDKRRSENKPTLMFNPFANIKKI